MVAITRRVFLAGAAAVAALTGWRPKPGTYTRVYRDVY